MDLCLLRRVCYSAVRRIRTDTWDRFYRRGEEADEEEERGGSRIKKMEGEEKRDAGIHPTRWRHP